MRMLIHYTALLFDDLSEVRRFQDHTDDLDPEKVFGMLIEDMRSQGTDVVEPGDPMNDAAFVAKLTDFYSMSPSRYPAEAPLDAR
jgi:hypothetical protein